MAIISILAFSLLAYSSSRLCLLDYSGLNDHFIHRFLNHLFFFSILQEDLKSTRYQYHIFTQACSLNPLV